MIDAVRAGSEEGMIDFNGSLCDLIKRGLIAEEMAYANSPNPESLGMLMQGIDIKSDGAIIS